MLSSESSICVKVISHFTNVICLCAAACIIRCSVIELFYWQVDVLFSRRSFCSFACAIFATGCPWARTLSRKKSDVQTIPGQIGHFLHEGIEVISTLLARSTRVSRRVARQGGLTRLDYCFHVNASKHLTAKGFPSAVIQPEVRSNPGSCKEALN